MPSFLIPKVLTHHNYNLYILFICIIYQLDVDFSNLVYRPHLTKGRLNGIHNAKTTFTLQQLLKIIIHLLIN